MKKILILFTILTTSVVLSQKEANGKIYIEHPAIEIVDQFTKAYVAGDLEKIKELVADLAQALQNGRTTPGPIQSNEGWPFLDKKMIQHFPELAEVK